MFESEARAICYAEKNSLCVLVHLIILRFAFSPVSFRIRSENVHFVCVARFRMNTYLLTCISQTLDINFARIEKKRRVQKTVVANFPLSCVSFVWCRCSCPWPVSFSYYFFHFWDPFRIVGQRLILLVWLMVHDLFTGVLLPLDGCRWWSAVDSGQWFGVSY